jgi:hypothetical protein
MLHNGTNQSLRFHTISEIARRMNECRMTVQRAVKKAGIEGDAILEENGKTTPLFLPSRFNQIKELLK